MNIAETNISEKVDEIFQRLFPINRSVAGKGLRDSLEIINEYVPIIVKEYPSGEDVFGWEIPREWDVKQAYIENKNGKRIIDFAENNLHLLAHSTSYNGWVKNQELREHLYSIEEQPDAIPYITSVYEERWGFCLEHSRLLDMKDDEYFVKIDASLLDGNLSIGEGFVRGKTKRKYVFTYTGHPSMANDQLSGILTSMVIYDWVLKHKENLKYSYRFLFCPETVGTAAYLSENLEKMKKNLLAGYTVVFIGDEGKLKYQKSLDGNRIGDKAAVNVINFSGIEGEVRPYSPYVADERHFNAPGIDLNFGCFMRSGPNEYEEYHTSLDNKSIISREKIIEAAEVIIDTIKNIEIDEKIETNYFGFEPKLDKLGLYPTLGKKFDNKITVMRMLAIWRLSGKYKDLLEIAEFLNMRAFELEKSFEMAKQLKLIRTEEEDYDNKSEKQGLV